MSHSQITILYTFVFVFYALLSPVTSTIIIHQSRHVACTSQLRLSSHELPSCLYGCTRVLVQLIRNASVNHALKVGRVGIEIVLACMSDQRTKRRIDEDGDAYNNEFGR